MMKFYSFPYLVGRQLRYINTSRFALFFGLGRYSVSLIVFLASAKTMGCVYKSVQAGHDHLHICNMYQSRGKFMGWICLCLIISPKLKVFKSVYSD